MFFPNGNNISKNDVQTQSNSGVVQIKVLDFLVQYNRVKLSLCKKIIPPVKFSASNSQESILIAMSAFGGTLIGESANR
jgi:hypothetical protein